MLKWFAFGRTAHTPHEQGLSDATGAGLPQAESSLQGGAATSDAWDAQPILLSQGFTRSDWTPWIGPQTLAELKFRTGAAVRSYQGPALDLLIGRKAWVLDSQPRDALLAAIEACPETHQQTLAEAWQVVRMNDQSQVAPSSRSWPNQSFSQRLSAATHPVWQPLSVSAASGDITAIAVSWPTPETWAAAHGSGGPINESAWAASEADAHPPSSPLPLLAETRIEAMWAWRTRWESLREHHGHGVDFDELMRLMRQPNEGCVLLCAGAPYRPQALLAVVCQRIRKGFTLGERRIGTASVRQAALLGGHAAGEIDAELLRRLLEMARSMFRPDLFSIREIPIASPTYQAARALPAGWLVTSPSRVDQLHWTLELPASFDEYLEHLGSKSRQSVRYVMRRCRKELSVGFELITRADQVDAFLQAAESINRRTYQWQVGERVLHDEPTRAEYLRRAQAGTLRCYLMTIDGLPAAFARGQLRAGVYEYETPGYLPEYGKWSIGTVLLMHSIEDLIHSGACRVFDFGEGGDAHGYKSRFGNRSTPVRALDVACIGQWHGQAVLLAQGALGLLKNTAQAILGESETKRRIKAWLRR
ncbi:MAG: GNAT family N-acetyltransferase [Rubrivivax sp.]|nr:GNAT family N-acetyltransferase [Rubrivivax sp.]